MEGLNKQLTELNEEILESIDLLNIDAAQKQLKEIEDQERQYDFWEDSTKAQQIMKQKAKLEQKLQPWLSLRKDSVEAIELSKLNDQQLVGEIQQTVKNIKQRFDELRQQLKFKGPYDDSDVIILLAAGAGGTDAQDWTAMLLRMYSRWAEKNEYKVTLISESPAEEAGIKGATLEISGLNAYGKLAAESGVHRLVRQSPFNSDNLRQTSFAKITVLPKIDSPEQIEIDPKQLKIDVFRAGGRGGQSVNTTDSAVRITHLPTGITVSIQNERSQLQNKETAMSILRSKLAVLLMEQHQDKIEALKGPNTSAEWGNQIRNYVLHPYKLVKDLRSKHETNNADEVLDGDLNPFIEANLNLKISE